MKRFLYLVWALGSFAWLFGVGGWLLNHEGTGLVKTLTFLTGTIWAGFFFVCLIDRGSRIFHD
jgi:hypothetical protein